MIRYELRARNFATQSENRIHDDAVAKTYGFSGGLVPGVVVFAYIAHPVVERHGVAFLERGRLRARFVKPVYDGEEITVELEGEAATVRGPDGEVRAEGEASLAEAEPPVAGSYPPAPLPVPPPPARPEAFVEGAPLGGVQTVLPADEHDAYLEAIGERLPLYRERRVAHPGWLLQRANEILVANVRLGPWIHVSSEVRLFGPVDVGDEVSTRGRVLRTYERKGHRFVELEVLSIVDGRPVMHATHVAIYEPRAVGSS